MKKFHWSNAMASVSSTADWQVVSYNLLRVVTRSSDYLKLIGRWIGSTQNRFIYLEQTDVNPFKNQQFICGYSDSNAVACWRRRELANLGFCVKFWISLFRVTIWLTSDRVAESEQADSNLDFQNDFKRLNQFNLVEWLWMAKHCLVNRVKQFKR